MTVYQTQFSNKVFIKSEGPPLQIGDQVHCGAHGLVTITEPYEDEVHHQGNRIFLSRGLRVFEGWIALLEILPEIQ